jgi:hypothetical protein
MALKPGYLQQGSRRKYIERSEMWCWRRLEWRSFGHRVGNEVLNGVQVDRSTVHTTKKEGKANRICHILSSNCFLNALLKER